MDASPAVHRRAGVGRYVQEIASALTRIDGQNEYLAFFNQPQTAWLQPPFDRLPQVTTRLADKPWRLGILLAQLARLPQDSLFPDVDLFHATDYVLPHFARIRSVYTLYDLTYLLFPHMHTPLNRWFLSWTVPRCLKAADAVILISEHTRRDLISRYRLDEARLKVIHLGVSPHFRPEAPDTCLAIRKQYDLPEHFILSVGSLEPRKNFTTLLHVLHHIRKQGPLRKLVLAGKKGWLFEGFFQTLDQLGLEDQVRILDFVPEAHLPALYSAADLFVFPSLYEGFGLPVLEAMACGTPVICSYAASLPEVCGEAARLVDPLSVEAWAEAIESLIGDPARREELRALGFQQARRFTWERTAEETLKIYRQAAEA